VSEYIPDTGDVVWLEFNPQAGSEQAGRRPALVLTPKEYNQKTSLAVFAPITSKIKGYPFEVLIEIGGSQSVVLADHVKSLDWKARNARLIRASSKETLAEVKGKLKALLGF
jgi:mRNA interferase MazF